MPKVSNTDVRRAVIGHLQADEAVTDLQDADRIFGPQAPSEPEWPFTQYGAAIDVPLRGSCLQGQVISMAIHSFAKGPGENACEAIGAAIVTSLDGRRLAVPGGHCRLRYTAGRTLRDDADTNSWHRVSEFEIRVFV